MILPIGDDNSDRRSAPVVNYLLIAIIILVFVVFQGLGTNDNFTYAFATVPQEIVTGQDVVTPGQTARDPLTGNLYTIPGLGQTPISVYITLLVSLFMHGSISHILGNMLFLWIFGDNVEDALGHIRYLLFYLVCGVIASFSHVFSTYMLGQNPLIPSLGASGAISGVLGAYLILFPNKQVTVFLFRFLTRVPAIVAVGLWFVFQLISGLGMLGGESDGVAYAAHIGGFIAGLVLVKFFAIGRDYGGPQRAWGR
ncbi:MAG: rhomboid family intramembrane serine protease [Chloroflexi bacterium]|nr:rhomboid family intramembrane serine protease [Chloroflexota bacterium]